MLSTTGLHSPPQMRHAPLPELPWHHGADLSWVAEALYRERLLVFVLRAANLRHQLGRRLELGLAGGRIALSACVRASERRRGPGGAPDCGWHRDPRKHDLLVGEVHANFHTNTSGQTTAAFVSGQACPDPETLATLRPQLLPTGLSHANAPDGSGFDLDGNPVCYSGTLYPGDMVGFVDSLTWHRFDTDAGQGPRGYSSGLYRLQRDLDFW